MPGDLGFRALDEACCCVGNRQAENGSKPAFEHIKLVHSMAGAAVFIYLTDCLVRGEAHGISQIIAAGPAGFQRPKGVPLSYPTGQFPSSSAFKQHCLMLHASLGAKSLHT